jgi:hypothetical protein
MIFAEEGVSLTPVNFFALTCSCFSTKKIGLQTLKTKYLLPSTSSLCCESPHADLAIAWNAEGLAIEMTSQYPLVNSVYPNIEKGDAIEVFIDTRDMKSAGFNTRFCHHFFFLPQKEQAGELTHFRTEDSHEHCKPDDLLHKTEKLSDHYSMKIWIPKKCMTGYDPEQFDRLGFTYRIHRVAAVPQHFAVSSDDYSIDQQPSLWATLSLKK